MEAARTADRHVYAQRPRDAKTKKLPFRNLPVLFETESVGQVLAQEFEQRAREYSGMREPTLSVRGGLISSPRPVVRSPA